MGAAKKSVRVGIREIARNAGVSTATVSRVLNGNVRVDAQLAERVLRAAEQLGYQPSPAARYLRSKRSNLLGIVVPKLSLPYFSAIVNGAIDRAREYSQFVLVATVEGSRSTEVEYLTSLSRYMLDGLVYCPIGEGGGVEKLVAIPMVVAGRRHVIDGVPHVNTDDEKAGYLATRYLLELGRRRIAFAAGFWPPPPVTEYTEFVTAVDQPSSGSYSSIDRLRGYFHALREAKIDIDTRLFAFTGFESQDGFATAKELFSRMVGFDALIVPNSRVAGGAMGFFAQQGVRVPHDISIVSADDGLVGEHLPIPVTAIVHDMYQVGVDAVDQVNNLLSGTKTGSTTVDVRLQIRRSTARTADTQL